FGSTAAIFPIDEETISYMRLTGRTEEQLALVEAYAKEQGMWHDPAREPEFSEYLELDLGSVEPSIAGPKRPQDRILLSDAKTQYRTDIRNYVAQDTPIVDGVPSTPVQVESAERGTFTLDHGAVAVAGITSCTN